MKYFRFLTIGILFGIVMTKSEAISWYRIQEMFRFDSFHMYGIMSTALVTGIFINQIVKRSKTKTFDGEFINFRDKKKSIARYLLGGTIFGIGWALSGACPGPMYTLIGVGITTMIVAILSALLGTLAYGFLRDRLPH